MKKYVCWFLLGFLWLFSQPAFAQEKGSEKQQEKSKSEEKGKPSLPIRVQLVFSEYDGDKKISSMPYSFIAIADERVGGYYSTNLRTGVRIPVEIEGKDQKTTYLDVGSNIDCGIRSEEDGRYRVYLIFERSALYANSSSGEEKLEVSRPNGQPLIRQLKISENFVLKDGQTVESLASTDPLNGHVLRVSMTINVMK